MSLLTARQAAKELNLSPSTIRAWIAQRRIAYVRLGRAVRIPDDEIRRFLEDGYVPTYPDNMRDEEGSDHDG